jgi:isoquinoline 1-oxidoreductase subunit alpha
MATFTVNGERHDVDVPDSHPLLWVIRESLGLPGTKFGCGIGQCGACTVLVDGRPTRSCQFTAGAAEGTEISTIEGLSSDRLHPLQEAWIEEQVPQCGYCQSGQLMSASALLAERGRPTDAEIDRAMSGNLCRCGAYGAIRRAIHRAAELQEQRTATDSGGGGGGAGSEDPGGGGGGGGRTGAGGRNR